MATRLDKRDDVLGALVADAVDTAKNAPAPTMPQPSDVLKAQLKRGADAARDPHHKGLLNR